MPSAKTAVASPPKLGGLDSALRVALILVGIAFLVVPIVTGLDEPGTKKTVVTETPQAGGGKKTETEADAESVVVTLAGIGAVFVLVGVLYPRISSIKTPFGEIGLASSAEEKVKEEVQKQEDLSEEQKRDAEFLAASLILREWWGPAPNPPPEQVAAKTAKAVDLVRAT